MSKQEYKLKKDERQTRKQLYEEVTEAFAEKYSFLGYQVASNCLLSVASWNLEKYSDPPMRYRNHVMLTWAPGWVKSTMLIKMKKILGDEMVSTCGKVTDATLRGSVQGGRFTPPKPLRTPILVSTEFGQTEFEGELLHQFLNLLEEGRSNVSLNKIAQLSNTERSDIKEKYNGEIDFKAENEYTLNTDFVFWGATHDPSILNENALKSRFMVVTPSKPLTGEVTKAMDNSPPVESLIDQSSVKAIRDVVTSKEEASTDFKPPDSFYTEYSLKPREARDLQAYMAARNWWGLSTSPEVMEKYIEHLKWSRKKASLSKEEQVLEMIFDKPMTYEEIQGETGLTDVEVYKICERIGAKRLTLDSDEPKWVVRSGMSQEAEEAKEKAEEFLSDV